MGIIFSYFRKKKSTKDVLQKLQEDIDCLEEYRENTEQRRKKLVGSLVLYSIVLYLITAIFCYFYYLPPKLEQKLLYAIPFVAFPSVVYFIKRILSWYYRWKVRRNEGKLANIKKEKEKILDQVMETETYKVAKDILETFAPERIRKTVVIKSPTGSPSSAIQRIPGGGELRRRIIATPVPPNAVPRPRSAATPTSFIRTPMAQMQPRSQQNPPDYNMSQTPSHVPGPPMPRPLLPRERTYLDRFVEYLVGDGPANRFALICSKCESHNGMALRDEFQYIAFRCAYCHFWNPSRKQKPVAPKLEPIRVKQLVIPQTDEEFDDDDNQDTTQPGKDVTQELEEKKCEDDKTNLSDTNEAEEFQTVSDDSSVATTAKLSFPVTANNASTLTVSLDTTKQEEPVDNKSVD